MAHATCSNHFLPVAWIQLRNYAVLWPFFAMLNEMCLTQITCAIAKVQRCLKGATLITYANYKVNALYKLELIRVL